MLGLRYARNRYVRVLGTITTFIILFCFAYELRRRYQILQSSGYFKTAREKNLLVYCDSFNMKDNKKLRCGKPFDTKWLSYLEFFNLSDTQISRISKDDDNQILSKDPVFVTAFSDNHYDFARKRVLKSFSEVFPNRKIVIYDLGLNVQHLNKLRKLPYISEIRTFNYSYYPSYVGNLFEYRFKPLLMAEMLKDFEAVFYADAHITWLKDDNLDDLLLKKVRCQVDGCDYYSCLMFAFGASSIFATTDKHLYEYLPMDLPMTKIVSMGNAAFQLIYFTKDVRTNIFKWFALCALEEGCMAPRGTTRHCKQTYFYPDVFANCHRFDQSAFSILLANRNQYNLHKFIVPFAFGYHEPLVNSSTALVSNVRDKPKMTENASSLIYCDSFNAKNNEKPQCGKPFDTKWIPYLEFLNLSDTQISQMNEDDDKRILSKDPMFLTAFSDDHYDAARQLVLKSFSEVFPGKKIVIYDLGLTAHQLNELRKLSFVHEIRPFYYTYYPSYVSNWTQFRFKALIIAELLNDFEAVFYADAHITWLKDDLDNLLKKARGQVGDYYNYLGFIYPGHSIYAASDKRTYEYLPINLPMTKFLTMTSGGLQLIYFTKDVRANILKWYVLCALEEGCMAPSGTTNRCNMTYFYRDEFADCHAFDQVVSTSLLTNRNQYKWNRYMVPFQFGVHRRFFDRLNNKVSA